MRALIYAISSMVCVTLLVGCARRSATASTSTAPAETGHRAPQATGASSSIPLYLTEGAGSTTSLPATLSLRVPPTVEQQAPFTVRSVDACPAGTGEKVMVSFSPTVGGTAVRREAPLQPDRSWSVEIYPGVWAAAVTPGGTVVAQPGPATVDASCETDGQPGARYRSATTTIVDGGPGARIQAPSNAHAGTTITVAGLDGCPDLLHDDGAAFVVPPGENAADPSTKAVAYQSSAGVDRATGRWSIQLSIPSTVAPGRYDLAASCINRGGTDLQYVSHTLTVTG